eukprot:11323172-Heterocapsa_arctica.AAC.1
MQPKITPGRPTSRPPSIKCPPPSKHDDDVIDSLAQIRDRQLQPISAHSSGDYFASQEPRRHFEKSISKGQVELLGAISRTAYKAQVLGCHD